MTTSVEAIEAAWTAAIWSHEQIQAITDKVHDFEVTAFSEFEIERLSCNQEINFFEYVISRGVEGEQIGNSPEVLAFFPVEIRYTRQVDTEGAAFRQVRDALLLVQTLVHTELGYGWGGTVDRYDVQSEPPAVTQADIDGTAVYQGVIRFTGHAETSL
jgi:hypothetical protein